MIKLVHPSSSVPLDRTIAAVFLGMTMFATSFEAMASDPILVTANNVGAVEIGMSAAEVENAIGAALEQRDETSFGEACWITKRRGTASDDPVQITYVFGDDRLKRIDIHENAGKTVRTNHGITIGSSMEELARVLPPGYRQMAAPYADTTDSSRIENFWYETVDQKTQRSVIYETRHGFVAHIQIGDVDWVDSMESCL